MMFFDFLNFIQSIYGAAIFDWEIQPRTHKNWLLTIMTSDKNYSLGLSIVMGKFNPIPILITYSGVLV